MSQLKLLGRKHKLIRRFQETEGLRLGHEAKIASERQAKLDVVNQESHILIEKTDQLLKQVLQKRDDIVNLLQEEKLGYIYIATLELAQIADLEQAVSMTNEADQRIRQAVRERQDYWAAQREAGRRRPTWQSVIIAVAVTVFGCFLVWDRSSARQTTINQAKTAVAVTQQAINQASTAPIVQNRVYSDEHLGWSGYNSVDNQFTFDINDYVPGTRFVLSSSVVIVGPPGKCTDTRGTVSITTPSKRQTVVDWNNNNVTCVEVSGLPDDPNLGEITERLQVFVRENITNRGTQFSLDITNLVTESGRYAVTWEYKSGCCGIYIDGLRIEAIP